MTSKPPAIVFAKRPKPRQPKQPTSYHAIAEALNARGVRTARGGDWYSGTVRNVMLRDGVR